MPEPTLPDPSSWADWMTHAIQKMGTIPALLFAMVSGAGTLFLKNKVDEKAKTFALATDLQTFKDENSKWKDEAHIILNRLADTVQSNSAATLAEVRATRAEMNQRFTHLDEGLTVNVSGLANVNQELAVQSEKLSNIDKGLDETKTRVSKLEG